MTDQPELARARPRMPATYGVDRAAVEGMLPWSFVTERMTSSRNYWMASTRPNGRPHVAPVWGLWLDDVFYFSTDPASQKGRNLAANPEVVVHLESGDDVVILEGPVEHLPGASLPDGFADAYFVKYGFAVDFTNPSYGAYRLRTRAVWAWQEKDFVASATRWRFARA